MKNFQGVAMAYIAISLLYGCAPTASRISVPIVTDISSVDQPIKQGEKFYILSLADKKAANPQSAMIEKEFLEFIADDLLKKGYKRSQEIDSSDFIVTISWNTSTAQTSAYNITYSLPSYNTTTTNASGFVDGQYVSGQATTSSWNTKDYQYYVPPTTYHPEYFNISFYGALEFIDNRVVERYRADSKHNSNSGNVLTWAPEHIQKMLEVFQKSSLQETGYVGIAFNTENSQPKIYSVDPHGPAYRWINNLVGSDVIMVNDTQIRYRTQAQRSIKATSPGDSIKLTYKRSDGKIEYVVLKAANAPFNYLIDTPYF